MAEQGELPDCAVPVAPVRHLGEGDRGQLPAQVSQHIHGINVRLPFNPTSIQSELISHVLQAVNEGNQGTTLLNFPSYTKKTTAILCSLLAWIQHQESYPRCDSASANNHQDNLGLSPPAPAPSTSTNTSDMKIVFATRTLVQVNEIKRAFDQSPYHDIPCKVLHYRIPGCAPQDLLTASSQFPRTPAQSAALQLVSEAKIVICTYKYVLDPVMRAALGWDRKNVVVVLDEAHNVASNCRECVLSTEISSRSLEKNIEKLATLRELLNADIYLQISSLIDELQRIKLALEDSDSQLRVHVNAFLVDRHTLSGDLFRVLQSLGLSAESALAKSNFLSSLSFPSESNVTASDFANLRQALNIFRYISCSEYLADPGQRPSKPFPFTIRFSSENCTELFLMCSDPSIAYSELVNSVRRVFLASGALTPLLAANIKSELLNANEDDGNFPIISPSPATVRNITNDDLFLRLVSKVTENENSNPLCTNSALRDDPFGRTILDIFNQVRGGTLVLFPSKLRLENYVRAWAITGVLQEMARVKTLFSETRINFTDVPYVEIAAYETAQLVTQFKKEAVAKGAVLFAVARGTAVEGINYSGDECRCVIVAGIPYPDQTNEIVRSKESYIAANNIMDGIEWSKSDAFCALNTALGRLMRTPEDWGIAFIIDHRLQPRRPSNYACADYLPAWASQDGAVDEYIPRRRTWNQIQPELQQFLAQRFHNY